MKDKIQPQLDGREMKQLMEGGQEDAEAAGERDPADTIKGVGYVRWVTYDFHGALYGSPTVSGDLPGFRLQNVVSRINDGVGCFTCCCLSVEGWKGFMLRNRNESLAASPECAILISTDALSDLMESRESQVHPLGAS